MLAVLPFTALTTFLQSKAVKPAFQKNRDCFSSLNAFVQENVSGNRVVKAFAKEDYEISKFNKENDAFRDSQLKSSKIWMKYLPIFEMLSNLLTIILIRDADLILVMDNGRIIERGTHEELLSMGGYYAAAFRNQYGEIPEELKGGTHHGTK